MLGDLNAFQNGNSSSGGGKVGIVVCDGTTLVGHTCDNVVLYSSKSYYRKVLTESLESCVEPNSSTPYFTFDTHDLITVGQDYMVVKFELDIESEQDGFVPDVNRMPWTWIGTPPDMNHWGNTIVEIRGYWKCDMWNWFGKVVQQYQIKCSDDSIDGSDDDE